MAAVSLVYVRPNAVFGLSRDSVVAIDARPGVGVYFVDVWLASGRVSLALDPPDYRRVIELVSSSLDDDLRSALLALPALSGFVVNDDDDDRSMYIDLDDLLRGAAGRVEAQHWALNAAIAALDSERDAVLVRVLTAIRDVLRG